MISANELKEIVSKSKIVAKTKLYDWLDEQDEYMTKALIETAERGLTYIQFKIPQEIDGHKFTSYEMLSFLRERFSDFTINKADSYEWMDSKWFWFDFDW